MTPLPHTDLLTALGEVAAAFVGFSLVVAVLRARPAGSVKEIRRFYSMRDVAEIGLLVVGGAFLPLIIHAFGTSPQTAWRLASATLFVAGGLSLASSLWRQRRIGRQVVREAPILAVMIAVLNLASFSLLLSNIFVGGATSGARYTATVFMALAIAGVTFVHTTFSDWSNESAA